LLLTMSKYSVSVSIKFSVTFLASADGLFTPLSSPPLDGEGVYTLLKDECDFTDIEWLKEEAGTIDNIKLAFAKLQNPKNKNH